MQSESRKQALDELPMSENSYWDDPAAMAKRLRQIKPVLYSGLEPEIIKRAAGMLERAIASEKTAPVPMPVSRYGVRGNGPGFGGYEIFAHDEGPMVHYADYAALEKLYIEQTGCCTRTEREGKA